VREHSNKNGLLPRIPAVRIGDRWRYSEAAIERWLKGIGNRKNNNEVVTLRSREYIDRVIERHT
jgi:hypothetical protein